MKGLLLISVIVAVFVAVVITVRMMAPPHKPAPQLAAVSPSVERLHKTDKDGPDIRVIPLTKPTPLPEPPKVEEPPPAPSKVEPPKEDNAVLAPVEVPAPIVAPEPPPARENNNGVCARYGGYKVTTYRHGWQSWHCVYPHRR
jgi:hypothetical protein